MKTGKKSEAFRYTIKANNLINYQDFPGAGVKLARSLRLHSLYETYMLSGKTMCMRGEYKKAEAKFKIATIIHPTSSSFIYLSFGILLREKGQFEEAEAKFHKASEINPNNSVVYLEWGRALIEQSKYEEAIIKCRILIDKFQQDTHVPTAYKLWGDVLCYQKKYDEAIIKYRKALDLKPNFADVYNSWGLLFSNQCKYEEAITKFNKVLEINHSDSLGLINCGMTLAHLNNRLEAEEKYAVAIEGIKNINNHNRMTTLNNIKKFYKVELERSKRELSKIIQKDERNHLETKVNELNHILDLLLTVQID